MADMLSPLEALSYVQQQGEMGRQRGQQNQLNQLAAQSYTAPPEQQSALLGQIAAINPQAAQTQQTQFQGQEDRRNRTLANMANLLVNAPAQARPALYQKMLPSLQQFGIQAPAAYDESTAPVIDQTAQALYKAYNGTGAGGAVQSTYVDDQGQRVAILRDGSTRVLGGNDAGASQQTLTIDIGGVPTQVTFDRRTGRYSTATVGGQVAPGAQQATPQPGLYNTPNGPARINTPLTPEEWQLAQADMANLGASNNYQLPSRDVAPQQFQPQAGTPLVGRTKEAEAAAVEAAKQAVQLQYLPATENVKTNAAIQQAGGTAQAQTQAKQQAEMQQQQQTRARDASDTLSLLDQAEKLLPGATGGRAGSLGDTAAAMFGVSTPGAQATAQLQTIAGQLTSKMPRMQGPQSDRDVQLYQQMAGDLANPNVPVATRQAALQTIRELNRKYASGRQQNGAGRTVVRTGTLPDGRKVVQYSDGTTDYGN